MTKRTFIGRRSRTARASRLWRAAAAAVAACVLGACSPSSVTFNFGPTDGPLREATVMGDGWFTPKVALIDVNGLIADAQRPALFEGGPNPVDIFVARLERAEQDRSVRAVVVRINSPGGTVTGSEIMYRELRGFAERTGRPVVASLGEVAASGGYYLALAADEIVAEPTGITGSIGVIIPTVNVSEGMRRIGIVSRAVKSGPNKDLANPLEPMRDGQYAVLQTLVDEYYGTFRGRVVDRRPRLDASRVEDLTDGRVVTGAEAARTGLADSTGGIREAFERAQALAGISNARLVKYHLYGERPRTPYSPTSMTAPAAAQSARAEVNLLSIDGAGGLGQRLESGNAYFLWIP